MIISVSLISGITVGIECFFHEIVNSIDVNLGIIRISFVF